MFADAASSIESLVKAVALNTRARLPRLSACLNVGSFNYEFAVATAYRLCVKYESSFWVLAFKKKRCCGCDSNRKAGFLLSLLSEGFCRAIVIFMTFGKSFLHTRDINGGVTHLLSFTWSMICPPP